MTTERRLAKVEASLGPKGLVLRWLAEAHAYDDFTGYTRAIYAVGPESMPLDRLIHETIDWVEASKRNARATSKSRSDNEPFDRSCSCSTWSCGRPSSRRTHSIARA